MTEPDSYTSTRYLTAKATVDARSRHPRLYNAFVTSLTDTDEAPLRLFEMGGGVGTLCKRLLTDLLARGTSAITYTMVDTDAEAIAQAKESLAEWARDRDMDVFAAGERLVFSDATADIALHIRNDDAFAFLEAYDEAPFDGIVAQAVLDIVHVSTILDHFRDSSHPGTHWYLPIHFDGVTAFEPTVDPDLDATIERLFHDSMHGTVDPHGPKGGPTTGRTLLTALPDAGAAPVDAAASDWIVYARDNGAYPADEAYFLHHILHFVESELAGHPDLDADAFADWLRIRRDQIASGDLVYLAHQVDVLAQAVKN